MVVLNQGLLELTSGRDIAMPTIFAFALAFPTMRCPMLLDLDLDPESWPWILQRLATEHCQQAKLLADRPR